MQVVSTENVTKKIQDGMRELSDVVRVTMGGAGKNVVINTGEDVQIINDGVTIAKAINSASTGVKLAQITAENTNRVAGDGTTTAIVLLQAFVDEVMKLDPDIDQRKLREDIRERLAIILKKLDMYSRELATEDIQDVAYISSLDADMAVVIADVIKEIGKDGIITVEEAVGEKIEFETVKGIEVQDGFAHPFFITDEKTQKAIMKNVGVLVSQKRIGTASDILPLLEELTKAGMNELVIFCEEITDEVLVFLMQNKSKFSSLVVKTLDLENVALASGATIVTSEGGEKYEVASCGILAKVEADKYTTKLIMSEELKIDDKLKILKERIKNEKDDMAKAELQRSIAALTNKVAVVKVTGETKEELTENKLKMEDALNAVKAAMDEGIIDGGGIALWRIAKQYQGSENIAENLMGKVCAAPFEQIMLNADIPINPIEIELSLKEDYGVDVTTGKIVNCQRAGIIDPVKVTKTALKNAVTTGTSILTSQGMIVNK